MSRGVGLRVSLVDLLLENRMEVDYERRLSGVV